MQNKALWLFVDDQADEAIAIAKRLTEASNTIEIQYRTPDNFRDEILTQNKKIDGALLDVNLSGIQKEHGTGPGIAQDIRIKQRRGSVHEFPVVRFSTREQVRRNIGGDPGSDDLFDHKISKDDAEPGHEEDITRCLSGVLTVYSEISNRKLRSEALAAEFLGLDKRSTEAWSDWSLHSKLCVAGATAVHVAAGVLLRDFLNQPGLLINERVLSYRLGVDPARSKNDWNRLLQQLSKFRYSGAGAPYFSRWWARGLEDWWLSVAPDAGSLAFTPAKERVAQLKKVLNLQGLVELSMPKGSAGTRPWSPCSLSAEQDPPLHIPLDPDESVRFAPLQYHPSWVDPTFAAFGPAQKDRDNLRLNSSDLTRLAKIHRG
jgi:hypothetical protein